MSIDKSRKAMAEERLAAVRDARERRANMSGYLDQVDSLAKFRRELHEEDTIRLANVKRLYSFMVMWCSAKKVWHFDITMNRHNERTIRRCIDLHFLNPNTVKTCVEPKFLEMLKLGPPTTVDERVDQQHCFQRDVREMLQWNM